MQHAVTDAEMLKTMRRQRQVYRLFAAAIRRACQAIGQQTEPSLGGIDLAGHKVPEEVSGKWQSCISAQHEPLNVIPLDLLHGTYPYQRLRKIVSISP